MYKLDLEKLKEPEFKLPTSTGSLKKKQHKGIPKEIYFYFIDYAKDFVSITKKLENSRSPDLPPEKPVCRIRSSS